MPVYWTHNCCVKCWVSRWGETRKPYKILDPIIEVCCWCSEKSEHGIYVRHDPITLPNCVCSDV